MTAIPVPADQVAAYVGLLRLASRLLAREADGPLYQHMTSADAHVTGQRRLLIDPALTNMTEEQALEELAVEFCRLFIGPQPASAPYASAHHNEVKLGGQAANDLHTFLDRHGLHPVISERDAVLHHDHLAIELSLLAHLYDTATGATPGDITSERTWAAAHELLHTHIRPWADNYLHQLEHTAQLAPYTTIAHLTRRILTDAASWPATTTTHTTENPLITIYSAPWCAFCKRLKTRLDAEKLPYTEIDVEQDPDAAETVKKLNNGSQIIPTVVFADGTAMTNPTINQVKEHLAATA